MPKKFWWPNTLADQSLLLQNFNSKIVGYGSALGLTGAQTGAAQDLCAAFITALNFSEQSKTTMLAVTQWRDLVFFGDPKGDPTPPPPVFAVGALTATRGIVTQFFELRRRRAGRFRQHDRNIVARHDRRHHGLTVRDMVDDAIRVLKTM